MRSEKQREASRRNGAKSKGPITPRGKAISSRNRTTHGLLARTIVLDAESARRYHQLRMELHQAFQPRNAAEAALVENMAASRWRQIRSMSLQKAALDRDLARNLEPGAAPLRAVHALTESVSAASHRTLLNYELAFDSQFSRALLRWRQLRAALPQAPAGAEAPYIPSDPTLGFWEEDLPTSIQTQEVIESNEQFSGSNSIEPGQS